MNTLKSLLFLSLIASFSLVSCDSSKSSSAVTTDEDGWLSMSNVEQAMKNDKKYVIVDVYTKWCGPCKMMAKKTFKDPKMKEVFKNFHTVKFDAEGTEDITFQGKFYSNPMHDPSKRGRNSQHELSRFFSVRGYPTLVIMDTDFKIVDKIVGYKTPNQLIPLLEKYK